MHCGSPCGTIPSLRWGTTTWAALEAEGRDSEAMDEYRTAISRDPVVVEAFYSLGLLYRRHDRGAEADAAFAEYKRRKAESAQ